MAVASSLIGARSSLVLALCLFELFERRHDHLGVFTFYRVRHGTLATEAALADIPPQPGIVHRPILDAPHAPPWLTCLHDVLSPLAWIVPNVERLRLLEHLPAPFKRPPIEGRPEMHMEEHTVVLRSPECVTEALFKPLRRNKDRHDTRRRDSSPLREECGNQKPDLGKLRERVAACLRELGIEPFRQSMTRVGLNSVRTHDALRRVRFLPCPKSTST